MFRIVLNATVQETERCESYQKTRRKKAVPLFDEVFSEGCSVQEAESIALQRAYGRNKHQVRLCLHSSSLHTFF